MTTIAAPALLHTSGTPGFRRLGLALCCVGFATFVLVYAPQGLLPVLAAEFGLGSGTASLALSATTLTLAAAVVPLSVVAESWGRRSTADEGRGGAERSARVMTTALAAAAVLGLLAPLAPTFAALVGIRALQGVAVAALPALAMAHLSREVSPRHLGGAMGMLIAGNAIGGLAGRLVATAVADLAGWRVALLAVGVVSVACTVAFRLLLPPAVAPAAPPVRLRELGGPLRAQLGDPGLRHLFGLGFVMVGAFVTVYNVLAFRLLAAPFALPATLVGLLFVGYVAGSWASSAAGRLGDRFGRRRVLWVGILVTAVGIWATTPDSLPAVLAGLLVLTLGFFATHSLASSWVGRRSALVPGGSPALASSLYLCGFYVGSAVGGTLGGVAFDHLGWPGVVGYVTALLAAALVLALRLRRIPAA